MSDNLDLFRSAGEGDSPAGPARPIEFAPGAWHLPGGARRMAAEFWNDLQTIWQAAPPRHMQTPRGGVMSVAISNCGDWGWVADRRGYRYAATNPETGRAWPAMPARWREFAAQAAALAGYADFAPDACLINRYTPGTKMGLHQDRDERDFAQPIVSVSLGQGVPFQFGGAERGDPTQRVQLSHGDVLVWGGATRLNYHGVLTLRKQPPHPAIGEIRVNLTFRCAC